MLDILQKHNQIQIIVKNYMLLQTITHIANQMQDIILKLNQIQITI